MRMRWFRCPAAIWTFVVMAALVNRCSASLIRTMAAEWPPDERGALRALLFLLGYALGAGLPWTCSGSDPGCNAWR